MIFATGDLYVKLHKAYLEILTKSTKQEIDYSLKIDKARADICFKMKYS